jgi:hypothetical protein
VGSITYAGHEIWSGVGTTAGSFNAEANPDPVVATAENTNELFIFGTRTLQVYGPDSTFVFVPIIASEVGCVAPHSIVKADQAFFWLSDKLEFVSSNGRSVQSLNSPAIAQTLRDLAANHDVSTCFGYRVKVGRVDAIAWTFPSDGRTFVLQLGGGWSQWSGWDTDADNFKRFMVNAHHLTDQGRNFVGTVDGKVGELSASAFTDLGEPIQAHASTGFKNHGTERMKKCNALRMAFRFAEGARPNAWLEWRDRPGEWDGRIPIELDTLPEVEFRQLGVYRRRQWRLRFTGTDELVLASVQEDFEVLEQ